MGKLFEGILVLCVAAFVVSATGVTIHDANEGQPNRIAQRVEKSAQAVVRWFGSQAQGGSGSTAGASGSADAGQPNLKQETSQRAWIPTIGAIAP